MDDDFAKGRRVYSSGYGLRDSHVVDSPLPPEEERMGPHGVRHRMYPAPSPIKPPSNIDDGWGPTPPVRQSHAIEIKAPEPKTQERNDGAYVDQAYVEWAPAPKTGHDAPTQSFDRDRPAPTPSFERTPDTPSQSFERKDRDAPPHVERERGPIGEGALGGWAPVLSAEVVTDANQQLEEAFKQAGRDPSVPIFGRRPGMGDGPRNTFGPTGAFGRPQDSGWGSRSGAGQQDNGWASRGAAGPQQDNGWGSRGGGGPQDNGWASRGAAGGQQDSGWGSRDDKGNDSSGWGATNNQVSGWGDNKNDNSRGGDYGVGDYGGGGGRDCYGCGQSGHIRAECPNGGGGSFRGSCHNCGESGHMRSQCPNEGGGGGGYGGGGGGYGGGGGGYGGRGNGGDDTWGQPKASDTGNDGWGEPQPKATPTATNTGNDGWGEPKQQQPTAADTGNDGWGERQQSQQPQQPQPAPTNTSSQPTASADRGPFINPARAQMIEQENRRSSYPVRQPGGPSDDNNFNRPSGPGPGLTVRPPLGESREPWGNRNQGNDNYGNNREAEYRGTDKGYNDGHDGFQRGNDGPQRGNDGFQRGNDGFLRGNENHNRGYNEPAPPAQPANEEFGGW